MSNGFNKDGFMAYLESSFEGFENHFLRETVDNLIDYGLKNHNHSLDQFCYWLSDMLPEVEFKEVAVFMDDSLLTQHGQEEKREAISEAVEADEADMHEFTLEGLRAFLDERDWSVSECSIGPNSIPGWELSQGSPAGEDFSFAIEHNNDVSKAIEGIRESAYEFDVDEHIEMWIEARNNGVSGVPGSRELVEDAKAIQEMLNELAADVLTWEANQQKPALDDVIFKADASKQSINANAIENSFNVER